MKSNGGGILLLITYFAMLGVFFGLNFIGKDKLDIVSITINAMMFVIVGFVILWANAQCLSPVAKMTTAMDYTIQKMKYDFKKADNYLWEQYRDEPDLFQNKILNGRFNEYRLERKRLNMISKFGAKCDVDDYINEYFIDGRIKKGLIGTIPGMMTGLGILGTFIGLAFGLQSFNTGSAQEITDSISPLMDGIKVAFHTSIYGMVFSLMFNFVFKKTLEDAYDAVDRFLENYHKYVLPKTENDDLLVLLDQQEKQLQQMEEMLHNFSDELAIKIVRANQSPYQK